MNLSGEIIARERIGTVAIEVHRMPHSWLMKASDRFGVYTEFICRVEPQREHLATVADLHVRNSQAQTRRN